MKEYKLGDVTKEFYYGAMPKEEDIRNEGYPIYSGYRYVGFSSKKNIYKRTLIVVARGVGGTGDVKIAPPDCFLTNLSIALDLDENIVDIDFLKYYLNTQGLRYLDTGAAQSQITIENLKKHKIIIPNLDVQKRIVSILKKYDDLIDNCNKRITILDQMIKNLYREWFVRYRFPEHNSAHFENGVPITWKKIKIRELAKLKSGYAFKSKWFCDDGYAVAKIKDIGDIVMNTTNLSYVQESICEKAQQFLLREGDLTIALTGATIGKISITPQYPVPIYTNQRLGKFFCGENPIKSVPFLYCFFSQNEIKQMIMNLSNSSCAQPNISPEQIEKIQFIGDVNLINIFNEKTSIFLKQMLFLTYINNNLKQQRDYFLPRLMGGKIEIA